MICIRHFGSCLVVLNCYFHITSAYSAALQPTILYVRFAQPIALMAAKGQNRVEIILQFRNARLVFHAHKSQNAANSAEVLIILKMKNTNGRYLSLIHISEPTRPY